MTEQQSTGEHHKLVAYKQQTVISHSSEGYEIQDQCMDQFGT